MEVAIGSRVLEIGCGAGRVTQWLCKAVGENGSVLGIDLQKSMIKKAEKKLAKAGLSNYRIESGNFLEMNFGSTRFDQVVMVTVLGEIPQRQEVLSNVCSLLKKEGRLSICEVIPDPCYISHKTLQETCLQSNFLLVNSDKKPLCYVANFAKT